MKSHLRSSNQFVISINLGTNHHSVLPILLAEVVESLLRVFVPDQVEAVSDERNPDGWSCRIIIRQSSFIIPEKNSNKKEQDHFNKHFGKGY